MIATTTLSPWTIYLWGIVDNVREVAMVLAVITGILSFVGVKIICACIDTKAAPSTLGLAEKATSVSLVAFLLAIALRTFVPDRQTIAIMVVAPAIVNSQPIQKDLPELYSVAMEAVKEGLKAALPKSTDKK